MKKCCSEDSAMKQEVRRQQVVEIVERFGGRIDSLIMILQDIQQIYRYLPEEALRIVSDKMEVPMSQLYEVATFYRAFSLEPKGRHEIKVCLGTACHLRSGPLILENFERLLGIKYGGTTSDKEFTLETVNCVGACALAPVIIVDSEYLGRSKPSGVKGILKKYSGM